MSRLVRLLSAGTAVHHPFGRLRASRGVRSCREKIADAAVPVAVDASRFAPSVGVIANRTAAVRPTPAHTPPPVARAAVRVYRGTSGMTMVGKIDAICRMIDRCIADERALSTQLASEA